MGRIPSVNELYETILSRSSLPLPGFGDNFKETLMERAERIHGYLLDRADRLGVECESCFGRSARGSFTRHVFETPWDEKETEKHFCSEECETDYLHGGDFSYFTCGECEREIRGQNPRNGWHVQHRDYDGETVCLRCYEGLILENGMERGKLEKGLIPGMFFSWDNSEPLDAGYRQVPGFTGFFVRTERDAGRVIKKALALMDRGEKVVIGYERLAIGGDEGYVTLFEKDNGEGA
jgi:hypothetical protein